MDSLKISQKKEPGDIEELNFRWKELETLDGYKLNYIGKNSIRNQENLFYIELVKECN